MDYRNEMADLVTEFKGMPKHALNIDAKQRMLSDLKQYQESVYPTRSRSSQRSRKLGTLGAGVAAVIAVCGLFWSYEHQVQGSQQVRRSITADQSNTVQATKNPYVQPQWIPSGYKVGYQQILTNGNSSSYEFEEVKDEQNTYSVTEIKTPPKLSQFLHTTGMFTPGTFPWMQTSPFRYDGIEIGRDISTVRGASRLCWETKVVFNYGKSAEFKCISPSHTWEQILVRGKPFWD